MTWSCYYSNYYSITDSSVQNPEIEKGGLVLESQCVYDIMNVSNCVADVVTLCSVTKL